MTQVPYIDNPQTAREHASNLCHMYHLTQSDLPFIERHFLAYERKFLANSGSTSGDGDVSSTQQHSELPGSESNEASG